MFFRCVCCEKIKLKSAKTYTLEAQGTLGKVKEMFLCASCGDRLNTVYEQLLKREEVNETDE